MNKSTKIGFFFLVWSLISSGLLAQTASTDTLSIREVVISAYKPVQEAGKNEKTIDTLIMKREADATVSDMLSRYANVFIKTLGRGAFSSASFRGMSASHTQVLWNGLSLQTPMLGQVDFSLIPVYLVNRISILPGAGSVTTGSGALGGTLLLNSKPDVAKGIHLRLLSGLGSYSTFNEFVHFQVGSSKIQSSTRIYRNSSKNNFWFLNKDIATIDPKTGAYIYPRQQNTDAAYLLEGVMQSVFWQPCSSLQIQAHYWFQHSNRALPRLTTYEGAENANKNRQIDDTQRAVAKIIWQKQHSKVSFQSGLNYEKMIFSAQNLVVGYGYNSVNYSVSSILSNSNKLEYNYEAGKNTVFKIAYFFDYNHVMTKDTVRHTGYNQYQHRDKLYFSWQQKWTPFFSMQAFVQKEWVNNNSLSWVPYFGFDWLMPFDHRLVMYGNISREVRFPTLNDLYWQPGGNPYLLPEEGLVSSFGFRYANQWKKIHWKADVSWFYNDIKNWIIWMPQRKGVVTMSPVNIRKVVSRGLEMNFKATFPVHRFWVFLRAAYALNLSTNFGNPSKWGNLAGKQLPYTPMHSGNFSGDVRWKGFSVTWVYHAYSERFVTYSGNLSTLNRLNPYSVNDLYLGKTWGGKKNSFSVQLKIYNLFNKQYWSVTQRPLPGINYMLLFNYQF